ncbi:MAG TPA: dihydrodipicolinate synthase family protein [Anaerolineales bacterium]|nr:dihydrodipicolinate synthase family protein [Anaerolineales bacterium]
MKDFGPLVPIVTPCSPGGEPDLAGVQAVCREMIAAGCRGIFVAGSTGRGPWFSRADRANVCAAAADVCQETTPLIAGASGSGLPDMLDNARAMADAGARIVVATVPGYYKYNPAEIEAIYLSFADASPLPVMVYDIPEFTHTKLDEGLVLRLGRHGNVAAFKDSSADGARFGALVQALAERPDFLLFQGKENLLLDSLQLGASGFIVSLVHLAPQAFVGLYRAARAGDLELASAIQERINAALVLIRGAIDQRPESSTLFYMLNQALRQRGVCENVLLSHESDPPAWLADVTQRAIDECVAASELISSHSKG